MATIPFVPLASSSWWQREIPGIGSNYKRAILNQPKSLPLASFKDDAGKAAEKLI